MVPPNLPSMYRSIANESHRLAESLHAEPSRLDQLVSLLRFNLERGKPNQVFCLIVSWHCKHTKAYRRSKLREFGCPCIVPANPYLVVICETLSLLLSPYSTGSTCQARKRLGTSFCSWLSLRLSLGAPCCPQSARIHPYFCLSEAQIILDGVAEVRSAHHSCRPFDVMSLRRSR